VLAAAVAFAAFAPSAGAVVLTGAGGGGVPIRTTPGGQGSDLIGVLDYSDTFTQTDQGGPPNRPSTAAVQPAAAYVVQNTYGNPAVNFQTGGQPAGVAAFSFASDGPGLVDGVPAYPGTSGAGSATGFTQTGGGVDYGVPYGLRDEYIVQVDAVTVGDRIDITSGPNPGTIFQGDSLSVFFRGNGSGNASLYNGTTDTPIQTTLPDFNTGISGPGQWRNYAVRFDLIDQEIELYVDEVSVGVIDLTTFAGGLYANFSNGAVGAGAGLAAGETRTWTDNFQVGAVVPEPGAAALLAVPLVAGLLRRRRS
jgi:hypothetical protein